MIPEDNFKDRMRIAITMTYFSLTTLSSVGFGDYEPKGIAECLMMIPIFLFGTAIFSWILGLFIQILEEYNEYQQEINDEDRLAGFFGLMRAFNGEKDIN